MRLSGWQSEGGRISTPPPCRPRSATAMSVGSTLVSGGRSARHRRLGGEGGVRPRTAIQACDLASPFSLATSRCMKPRATRRSPPRQQVPRSTCARGRREQPATAHPPPSGKCAGSSIAHAVIDKNYWNCCNFDRLLIDERGRLARTSAKMTLEQQEQNV